MIEYYDAVLGLIPLSFLGLGGLLSGAGVSFTIAVPIAALVAAALIGHAMFVNTPGDASPQFPAE
ncbi:MAG: hypothetical protein ABEH88_01900 [Halobacteriales archaeon]